MKSYLIATKGTPIYAGIGIVGSIATKILGGWDNTLQTLMIFMIIDFGSGWLLAALFKKSPKSADGGLESKTGWKGLCRKGMTLAIVSVATQLDSISGTALVRNATIIGFIINEGVSITENAGLMGLPMPKFLINSITALKKKVGDVDDNKSD